MAVSDLVAALAGADANRKRALIRELGRLGDSAAVPALSALVRDRTEPMTSRRLAARALGQIGDSRGCMALITVLSEPAHPDRRLIPRLEQLRRQLEQQSVAGVHQSVRDQQLAEIEGTIAHEGDVVRLLKLSAVTALGEIGYVLALKPLEEMALAGHDKDLAAAAQAALARVREKSGLDAPDEAPPEAEAEPAFVHREFLTCSRCETTSATGLVQRCQNCRLPVCEVHAVHEAGMVFCSQTCVDSFASQPGNWVYWT
ncbi:MAG: HEAT repeat domain-containing protein [Anaerolineae bacterium]|nr:HEAT repeat domain-containing protein [Anaerolineae bacterium]